MDLRQIEDATPLIHSLAWDPSMLDYKFFGYVVCKLAREEIRALWRQAPDRSETRQIEFLDVHNTETATRVVEDMQRNPDQWSDEARFDTIMSFVHLGRLSMDDLVRIAG